MKMLAEKYQAALSVAVALLAVLMIGGTVLFMWSLVGANKSEIEARQTELEVFKRRANPGSPAASVAANTPVIDPFFAGGAFALAANQLQQRVVRLIESSGGKLVTVGIDPPVTADDETGRRVVVQAVAELSNEGLQQVLYQLEATPPFVFIESLLVTRAAQRGTAADTEAAAASTRLSVDLRAAGYFRRPAR
jgi:hypothetical protein